MIIQEGKTPRKQGLRRDVTKKIAEMQEKACLFRTFAGQKGKRLYEKNIVCVSREYLSESDGGVRDEGPGGKGRARGGVLY